jgi:Poly(R)-hydroxyalkanoic acid synthase subunit (PHA_synth_III_E)
MKNAMNEGRSHLSGQEDTENKSKAIPEELIIKFDDMSADNRDQVKTENEVFSRAYQSWLEILESPTVGPFHAFTQGFFRAFEDILKISEKSTKLQGDLNEFLVQFNKTSLDAINLIYERSPRKHYENKEDFEEFRKVLIDAFEECFTRLFQSKEFAILWNRLFLNQSELLKLIQNTVVERNLKMLNLPTRDEFDSLLKDVHDLKRTLHDLRNSTRSN